MKPTNLRYYIKVMIERVELRADRLFLNPESHETTHAPLKKKQSSARMPKSDFLSIDAKKIIACTENRTQILGWLGFTSCARSYPRV